MKTRQLFKGMCYLVAVLLCPLVSTAAFLRNIPQTVTLPDHSIIQCFASGDEYVNWLHDEKGHTLIYNDDGYLYYAVPDGDSLKPSSFRVNSIDPESVGIRPGYLISMNAYQQKRTNRMKAGGHNNSPAAPLIPTIGIINNLVVFIRFSGENEFTDQLSYYDDMFNSVSDNANSMRRYFNETSYGDLTISTTFYPTTSGSTVVSYQDSQPRNYYQPYNMTNNPSGYQNDTQKTEREHALVINAFYSICGQIPSSLNVDMDWDGYVDNVCFIISGSPGGWNDIFWPHMWNVSTDTVFCANATFKSYNIQIQNHLYIHGNGVLCHEMFHSLGAPDLYHYVYAYLDPVGTWDVMDANLDPPEHMCAFMKHKYVDWNPMPVLTTTGRYTLNPLNSPGTPQTCYRINSPYSTDEYFVVEYRRKTGTFESSLPGEGMVIYRINTNFTGNGGYNDSTVFDEVYAYRPGGTPSTNGISSQANYSQLVGRTAINCNTSPSPFLTNGNPSGLFIRDITDNSGTLSFTLIIDPPAGAILNQPNTSGIYAARDEIILMGGFSTTPTNSFEAYIDNCPVPPSSPMAKKMSETK